MIQADLNRLDPALVKRVRDSKKFQQWQPARIFYSPRVRNQPVTEQHFSPAQLASQWGLSDDTIRRIFDGVDGVLRLEKTARTGKRPRVTIRIPLSVAERVHRLLSTGGK
jgi:hypothetical protein